MMPDSIGMGKFSRVKEEMIQLKKQKNQERKKKIQDKIAILAELNHKKNKMTKI